MPVFDILAVCFIMRVTRTRIISNPNKIKKMKLPTKSKSDILGKHNFDVAKEITELPSRVGLFLETLWPGWSQIVFGWVNTTCANSCSWL